MANKTIVIALGGNALGNTPQDQIESVRKAADVICKLAGDGYNIIIGHGNGPQVGMIDLAMDYSANGLPRTPYMPLAECDAMSQGYIGYHLQQALEHCLSDHHIERDVISVITQVVVDQDDPAFQKPEKPVGRFYSLEEARKIEKEKGFRFVEDSGRGYRKVVPSPKPLRVVELNAIRSIVQNGMIVITVGGGGIPVVQDGKIYRGVDAVVDKDKSCSLLAQNLNADVLLILTAVDKVSIHYHQPNQQDLSHMTLQEADRYIAESQFAPGSMLPKIEACRDFVKASGHTAIITSLSKARQALQGLTGTVIKMR